MNNNVMRVGKHTGSLVNHLMSGNPTPPTVGEGATILMWTDRHAYTVTEVSKDGKKVTIRRDKAVRTDGYGMSDAQQYRYEAGDDCDIVKIAYRWGYWRNATSNGKVNIVFGIRNEYYDYSF